MDEATKTRSIWGEFEKSIVQGRGIDIGCGPDPVTPDVQRFDLEDGDANHIGKYVSETFDFVHSSHCLEHMHNPKEALRGWWDLVRPGGHLILIVPDEDLYEQGVFPSRFNVDHKATFTISKARSWSPVSHNLLDLVSELPSSRVLKLQLQDHGYDRSLLRHGELPRLPGIRTIGRIHRRLRNFGLPSPRFLDRLLEPYTIFDQTLRPGVLAQIQCIVRKES